MFGSMLLFEIVHVDLQCSFQNYELLILWALQEHSFYICCVSFVMDNLLLHHILIVTVELPDLMRFSVQFVQLVRLLNLT